MGTVTQYKMSNFQSALGGSNPISMSEYYRGVTYVPTTGPNAFVRQPTSGEYYQRGGAVGTDYYWDADSFFLACAIIWETHTYGGTLSAIIPYTATTYSEGDSVFYRGTLREHPGGKGNNYYYAVYRYQTLYGGINTSVPTSSQIKFSNMMAAQNYSPGFMGGVQMGYIPNIGAWYTGSNETITATATFYPNGTYTVACNDGISGPFTGNWGNPTSTSSAGSNYWIQFVLIDTFAVDHATAQANSTATTGWLNLSSARTITVQTFNNADPNYELFGMSYIANIALDSAGSNVINQSYAFGLSVSWDPPP